MRRKPKNGFLTAAIVFTVLTIIWIVIASKLVFLSFKDAEDIYDEDFNIVEHGTGGRIESTLNLSLGMCVYETTTTTKNGRTTSKSTDYYYVVPINGDDPEYYHYVCVKVDQDDKALFDAITNNSDEYFSDYDWSHLDKEYKFSGTLNELDDDMYEYMVEFFEDTGWYSSDAELKEYVLPIVLTPMNFDAAPTYIIIFIVLLVLTILFWALFFVKKSKVAAQNAVAQAQFQAQFPGQEFGQYVVINGVSYPKDSMAHINTYVNNHENVVAIQELRNMTGLGLAEAKAVIDNWYQYYM